MSICQTKMLHPQSRGVFVRDQQKVAHFDSFTWTHVVATVSGNIMKVYKNGVLAGTQSAGHEPSVFTRTQHWVGRSAWSADGYFDGTIAYLKMWHGLPQR